MVGDKAPFPYFMTTRRGMLSVLRSLIPFFPGKELLPSLGSLGKGIQNSVHLPVSSLGSAKGLQEMAMLFFSDAHLSRSGPPDQEDISFPVTLVTSSKHLPNSAYIFRKLLNPFSRFHFNKNQVAILSTSTYFGLNRN